MNLPMSSVGSILPDDFVLPTLWQELDPLYISEVFVTIQGEGPFMGQRAIFIRLMGCNLACTWCDTPYTWDKDRFDLKKEGKTITAGQLAMMVFNHWKPGTIIVLTGGEPVLQQDNLAVFCQQFYQLVGSTIKADIHIETAGTIQIELNLLTLLAQVIVSPKLKHSGNDPKKAINHDLLKKFASHGSFFKFVVRTTMDLLQVDDIVIACEIPNAAVYIMPEGTTEYALLSRMRILADTVIDRGWNMTTRMHTLIWGNTRGI